MRYYSVPTISFKGADGVVRALKDLREIPVYTIRTVVKRGNSEPMDYTAQRQDVLGANQEPNSYLLWEANHIPIVEMGFDITTLITIRVPVQRT